MVMYASNWPVIRYRLLIKDWHKSFLRNLGGYFIESISPVRNLLLVARIPSYSILWSSSTYFPMALVLACGLVIVALCFR